MNNLAPEQFKVVKQEETGYCDGCHFENTHNNFCMESEPNIVSELDELHGTCVDTHIYKLIEKKG